MIVTIVLLLVQNSVGYFRQRVVEKMQLMNEYLYIERGFEIIDKISINSVLVDMSTSTDGFDIKFDTYLDKRPFLSVGGFQEIKIRCSQSDQRFTLVFLDRNKEIDVWRKPYVHIKTCNLAHVQHPTDILQIISSSNFDIQITTSRNTYSHPLLNFSQFLEK